MPFPPPVLGILIFMPVACKELNESHIKTSQSAQRAIHAPPHLLDTNNQVTWWPQSELCFNE